MNISVNTLCYEVVQRKYRNAVVRHVRARLTATFPNDWEEKVKALCAGEWPTIVKNAEIYRQTGEVESTVRDVLDYLGVNHFFNLFDQYFDVIFPLELRQEPEAKKELKAAVLRWAKSIRNVRDPLSHPPEEDLSIWDALSTIDSARRIVRIFAPAVADEIKRIGEVLIGRRTEREPLTDNLPPRETIAVRFIGRTGEINTLQQWLEDKESHRWMLVRDGGKGKTAIAYEFAVRVKYLAPSPYAIVLWLSAKKRKFIGGFTSPITLPDFTDLESLINKILVEYGWSEDITKPLAEKKKLALQLADNLPSLVVIDDLDSMIGEDPRAIEFATFYLPHTQSKVLISSRSSFHGLEPTTTLVQGFSLGDAQDFIKSRIGLFRLDPRGFTRQRKAEILKATDRSPLFIDDLMRLCTIGTSVESAIELWRTEGGDAAREFALRREFDMLGPDAKKVLLAASINPQPCSVSELEAVTEIKGMRLESALRELQRLFLIPTPKYIGGEPRFLMNANTRALVLGVMSQTDLYRRLEGAVNALLGQLEPSAERNYEVSMYLKHTSALVKLGRHADAEQQLLRDALVKYPNDPDLLAQAGWVYMNWEPKRLNQARDKFSRASKLKCKRWDMYWHWWRMECGEAEWAAALKTAKAGLKMFAKDWKLNFAAGYAGTRLGRELQRGLLASRARAELTNAQAYLEDALALTPSEELSSEDRQFHSELLRALVLNSEALRHTRKLGYYLQRWCAEHPDDRCALTECVRLSKRFPKLAQNFPKLREYLEPENTSAGSCGLN